MTSSTRSMVLMVVFAALWALVDALASHMVRAYSGYQVVWMRYGVHLAFMLLVWGWRVPRSLIATSKPALQLARSVFMLIMPASFLIGLKAGTQSDVISSEFWIAPLLIVAFSVMMLGERPPLRLWIAAAVAFAGAVTFLHPTVDTNPMTVVWPLLMAVSFSLYVVMTRMLRTESTRSNLFYTAFGVFILLTPLMPSVWVRPSMHDAVIMICIGLLGYLGLYVLDRMAHDAQVSQSAPLITSQVVFATAISVASGHPVQIGVATVAGVALIACAVLIAIRVSPSLVERSAQ